MFISLAGSRAALSGRRAVVLGLCLLMLGCGPAERTGTGRVASGAASEWRNRTYTVTCDGIVPGGFRATVVDGATRVAADGSRPPYYESYDLQVTATASGDVDGDGAPDTVVLLECSPAPSNFFVQEVQIFSSTGRLLGALPSPRTLQGQAPLPPVYDPTGLSVRQGEVVATMKAYGPQDSHASGPSVPLTVRWRFDRRTFVRVAS